MTANVLNQSDADARAQSFMRLCLQRRRNPAALAAAAKLAGDLDWETLGRLASTERVGPLLYQAAGSLAPVPARVQAKWRKSYLDTARRNLPALHDLSLILRRLQERQVEVLVLKGAGLISTVYGNIALRPLRDLDLLVRPAGLEPALNALKGLGYQQVDRERQAGSLQAFENQSRLVKPGPLGLVVEIHWSLFDSPHYQNRLALDWFWLTRQRVTIDGVPTDVPGPGAHLLYLAGHLWLHHQGQGLLWWNDLAELAAGTQGAVDWEQVLGWAQACDLVLPLQRVAAGLVGEWAVPMAEPMLARILALRPSAAEQRVFGRLISAERSAGRRLWVDLESMPGWGRRMRFAWSNLWPSPAYMRMRYNIRHGLLTPLYYPYRWLLGIRSALWKV